MDAHNLFEYAGCTTALARKNDPQSSKDAAEKMVKSGALSRQEDEVLYVIWSVQKSDFTTKEIAEHMIAYPYHKAYDICRKRFSGLRNKSKIERTGEIRDGCFVERLV